MKSSMELDPLTVDMELLAKRLRENFEYEEVDINSMACFIFRAYHPEADFNAYNPSEYQSPVKLIRILIEAGAILLHIESDVQEMVDSMNGNKKVYVQGRIHESVRMRRPNNCR